MTELTTLWKTLLRPPNKSIGNKLFLLFFGFVCLSVAALGLYSYSVAKSAILDQARQGSRQTVSLAGEKLDMKLQFYLDLASQLQKNSVFQEHIFQFANAATMPEDELKHRIGAVRDLLDQLILSDGAIRDMSLISLEDPIEPISTQREGLQWSKDAPWIQSIVQAEGKPAWLPIQSQGYLGGAPKPLFAFGKLFGENNVGSHDFVLLVQIEASVLQDMISDVRLSPGAETAIFDAAGNPVISTKPEGGWSKLALPASASAGVDADNEGGAELLTVQQEGESLLVYRVSPVSKWMLAGIAPLQELTGASGKIRTTTYAAIAVSVVLALLIGLWLVWMIGRPLGKLEKLMRQAAEGDLRGRLDHKGRDEIGQVAGAYNRMMSQIGSLVTETRLTVEEVASASDQVADVARQTAASSEEIHQASGQIAEGAAGLAANAEKTNGKVEEMGGRLQEAFELQNRTADAAGQVDAACREGGSTVQALIRKSSETEERIRLAGDRMAGLQASAKSIRDLLELMTQMAKQTRILSLNASIEATRAGLAGAGFRVIAEEIRRLADQSNASIEHVGVLTDTIEGEVASTADAMSAAMPFFRHMIEDVHAVHRLFEEVQGHMERLMAVSGAMTGSIQALDETQAMLAAAVGDVSTVSQQSSASSEQVASLCATQLQIGTILVEMSNGMKEISRRLENHMSSFLV